MILNRRSRVRIGGGFARPGSQTRGRCDRRTRIPATGDRLDRIRRDEGDFQLEVSAESANRELGERSNGSNRVIRGGSWNNAADNCRAAYRNRNTPTNTNNNLGLRLARAPRRCGGRTGRNRPLSCSARADKSDFPNAVVLVAMAKAPRHSSDGWARRPEDNACKDAGGNPAGFRQSELFRRYGFSMAISDPLAWSRVREDVSPDVHESHSGNLNSVAS